MIELKGIILLMITCIVIIVIALATVLIPTLLIVEYIDKKMNYIEPALIYPVAFGVLLMELIILYFIL